MAIGPNEPILASDYIRQSAGASDADKVVVTGPDGLIDESFLGGQPPVVRVYENQVSVPGGGFFGDASTRWNVTNVGGSNRRYTHNGTGPAPDFSKVLVGDAIQVNRTGNNSAFPGGLYNVVGVGADYIELNTAASTASGSQLVSPGVSTVVVHVIRNRTWTKPAGLKYLVVEAVGAGGSSSSWQSTQAIFGTGAAGGYAKKVILASALGATEDIEIGVGGIAAFGNRAGDNGSNTSFGSHLIATFGAGSSNSAALPAIPGVGIGGDINISGQYGVGFGAVSNQADNMPRVATRDGGNPPRFGYGGRASTITDSNTANRTGGDGYLGGGGGGGSSQNTSSGAQSRGGDGILVLTEVF